MSFIVTASFVRPNTDAPFFVPSTEFSTHFDNTYVQTGKVLANTFTFSPDGLSITRQITWVNRPAYVEFATDPVQVELMSAREAHHEANGIVMNIHRAFADGETLEDSPS